MEIENKKIKILHNIGNIKDQNYNTREEILACNDFLTFDGIYLNVYENQDVLKGKKGIFFIVGETIGKNNAFDLEFVPKLERYCSLKQVLEMCNKYDFEIGYHSWSHPKDIRKLLYKDKAFEIAHPFDFPIKHYAFPHGLWDSECIEIVKKCGYEKAWSVGDSDGTEFTIKREYLNK